MADRYKNLDALKPLDPSNPDFHVAVAAMKNAKATARTGRHPDTFWLVDATATEAVDMVSVVDLTSLGNIAKGTEDWARYAEGAKVYPTDGEYATQDVLERLLHRIAEVREARETAPTP